MEIVKLVAYSRSDFYFTLRSSGLLLTVFLFKERKNYFCHRISQVALPKGKKVEVGQPWLGPLTPFLRTGRENMMKKMHGLRKDSVDICVKVVLCRLQVDSLFYHGLFHRLKENLCLAHLFSKHFSKLCVCRDILLFSFLSLRYCHTAFF